MFRKRGLNFILLILIVQQFQNGQAVPFTNEIQPIKGQPNEHGLHNYYDSECGGALEATEEVKALSYRMERPKDQYESCVWTIHALNGGSVRINVTSPLFYSSASNLAIGYFLDSSYDKAESLKWKQIPYTTDSHFIEVPAPVAFVHYLTEFPYPEFGFQLTYQAGETVISFSKFRNYFLQGEYGLLAYPPEGEETRSNERVSVVLKVYPGTAAQKNARPSWAQVIHKGYHGSGSCAEENINLFGYGEGEKKWFKNDTRCENSYRGYTWLYSLRNDPLIFTFKSGATGPVGAFEIRWMDYEY